MLIPDNRIPAYIDTDIKYVETKKFKWYKLKELTEFDTYKLKSIYDDKETN